jgi:nicotinate-nucleotide--dimethylbenzimidazole phosphoribosyltransferase
MAGLKAANGRPPIVRGERPAWSAWQVSTPDLHHHGDREAGPGYTDLAVNVRTEPMPPWLAEPLRRSLSLLSAYPDDLLARQAIARRHERASDEVLLTAGAAQAFTLVAQGLRVRRPLVIHPQFTEPEAALRAAGYAVERLILKPPFELDPAAVPDDADLVMVGNPTNPTSVLHPVAVIERLARPGRVLVVDEAFADTIAGEPGSVAHRRDLPGLLVVRSLTKTWGLAGLRIGYALGAPDLLARLRAVAPLWPVSTPGLAAAIACSSEEARQAADEIAATIAAERSHVLNALRALPAVTVAAEPASSFVLVHIPGAAQIRSELRRRGWAVRRGDTFPGLGADWLRIAVRDTAITDAFAEQLRSVLTALGDLPCECGPDKGGAVSELLRSTIEAIRPLDEPAMAAARALQGRLTKPAGSLGQLEELSIRLAGLAGQCPPPLMERAGVAVFAGDHGVHAQGVTPWPQEVTAQMVANFLSGGAVVNAFARQTGATVTVVDVGVAAPLQPAPGLVMAKVREGTRDMTVEPALTRDETEAAVEAGITVANQFIDSGSTVLLTGDMGIANTTPAAALIAVFTATDPGRVTGLGTGIDSDTHSRKIAVIRQALAVHQPDPADPVGVLACVGGLEHAALTGFILGGAARGVPVILDGVIACSAALAAAALAPHATNAMVAGHRSVEPGASAALAHLDLEPLVDLELRLGEGTGAVLALPIAASAVRVLHEVATFDTAGVTEK